MVKKFKNYLLIFVLAVIAAANIFYLIGISAYGAEMGELENEETAISGQIQNYKEQIMNKSSLVEIGKRAEELGFGKPQNVIYVAGESAVVAKLP